MKGLTKKISLGVLAVLLVVSCSLGILLTNRDTVKLNAETPTVTFTGVDATWNNKDYPFSSAHSSTILFFSKTFFDGVEVTNPANTLSVGYNDIATKMKIDGVSAYDKGVMISKNFYSVWGAKKGGLEFYIEKAKFTTGSILTIEEGTCFADEYLPQVTLKFDGTKWVECHEPTVTFTGVDATWNNKDYPFSSAHSSTILFFSKTFFDGVEVTNPANTLSVGYNDIATKMKIDGVSAYDKGVAISKNFYSVWGASKGGLEFYVEKAKFTTGSILTIEEGTCFADEYLPQVTLKFDGTKWVDTKVNVASKPWFNASYGDGGQYGIGLTTDAYNFTAKQYCSFSGFSINGNAIGSGILWAENQVLPLFDEATNLVDGVNGYDCPTFEIEDGAKAVGVSDGLTVYFKPLTLYYINGAWTSVDPSSLQFTGMSSSYNHGTYPWGDGAYNAEVLEFSKPLYTSGTTANMTLFYPALASGMKLNGVAIGTALSPNITFNVLGANGAIEIYYEKIKFPTLSKDLTQIILTIDEGTSFLENSLPQVTLYFNGTNWQEEEYTFVETKKANLDSISANFNNAQNPWRDDYYLTGLTFDSELSKVQILDSSTSDLGNVLKLNGVAVNTLGWLLATPEDSTGMNVQYPKSTIPTLSKDLTQIKLELTEAVIYGDVEIQPFALYFNGANWQLEEYSYTPPKEVTFTEVSASYNNAQNPWKTDYYLSAFGFSGVLSVAGVGDSTTSALGNALKLNGTDVNSLGWILSAPGNGTGMNVQYPKSTIPTISKDLTQVKLELTEAVIFGDVEIQPFALYFNGANWQLEEYSYTPPKEVNFVSIAESFNNAQNPWRNDYYLTGLTFDSKLSKVQILDSSTSDLGNVLKLNGVAVNTLGWLLATPEDSTGMNVQYPKSTIPTLSEDLTQVKLELTEAVIYGDVNLQPFILYYNGANWQLEEYSYEPPKEVNLDSVAEGFNNAQNPWRDDYYLTGLTFDSELSKVQIIDSSTSDLGNVLKLNGVAVNTLGWLLATPEDSTGMNVQYPKSTIPTLSEDLTQVKLELTEAVIYGDVNLQPFTLYLNGENKWQTEEYTYIPPEKVTFVAVSSSFNHGIYPFGDGVYAAEAFEFSKPLYTSGESTNMLLACPALANGMKINGEPIGTLLNPNLTFNVLGQNGAIEFYYEKANFPTLNDSCPQIKLTIDSGTLIFGYELPELTLYLNGDLEWQEEEYTYVYEPPKEVSLFEPSGQYNNGQNPWRSEYYLTALNFSDVVTKKSISDGSNTIGSYLTLNGVSVDTLGFMFSSNAKSSAINMQYPKSSVDCFGEDELIILELKEKIEFGSCIIKPFKLYLAEGAWCFSLPEYNEINFVKIVPNANNIRGWGESQRRVSLKFDAPIAQEMHLQGELTKFSLDIWSKMTINGIPVGELTYVIGQDESGNNLYSRAIHLYCNMWDNRGDFSSPNIDILICDWERILLPTDEYPVTYLHIEKGAHFGNAILPEIGLFLVDGIWKAIDGGDDEAPVFEYDGVTSIVTSEGKPFVTDIKAFDKGDNRYVDLEYSWSDGALDNDKNLVAGIHEVTLIAKDFSGNVSTLTLEIIVNEIDTIAPTIICPDTMKFIEGSSPDLCFYAEDNYDTVVCTTEWSEGALDEEGKLVVGSHTLTLTATDLSGNSSSKTVDVLVEKLSVFNDDEEDDVDDDEEEETETQEGCSSNISSNFVFFGLIGVAFVVALKKKKEN